MYYRSAVRPTTVRTRERYFKELRQSGLARGLKIGVIKNGFKNLKLEGDANNFGCEPWRNKAAKLAARIR